MFKAFFIIFITGAIRKFRFDTLCSYEYNCWIRNCNAISRDSSTIIPDLYCIRDSLLYCTHKVFTALWLYLNMRVKEYEHSGIGSFGPVKAGPDQSFARPQSRVGEFISYRSGVKREIER